MTRALFGIAALALVAACGPRPLDDSYGGTTVTGPFAQAQRNAALTGQPLDADALRDVQARADAAAANSGVEPIYADPSNPAPAVLDNPGISSEQDFESVSSRRSIETDAQRIEANRRQYTLITPTDLPNRPGSNEPNIVEYALRTNNPVGAQLYGRSGLRSDRAHRSACARFDSPDHAQTAFLSRGGPQRDRGGLDPDGDGYACSWDPTPFRKARGAAVSTAATAGSPTASGSGSSIIDPLVISSE